MKYNEMMKKLHDMEEFEKELGTELTEEQKDIYLEEGEEALIEKLTEGITEGLKGLAEIFTPVLTKLKEETKGKSLEEVLKGFLDYLTVDKEPEHKCTHRCIKREPTGLMDIRKDEESIIDRDIKVLKSGQALTNLPDEYIDKLVDHLWSTEDNVRIQLKNGELKLI